MDNKTTYEGKELIWVPSDFAEKYKKAASDSAQLEILEKILSRLKIDIKSDLEALEHDEAQFKASVLRYRKSFTEIYKHNAEQVNQLWDDIQKTKPDPKPFIDKLKNDLAPILEQIAKLSKAMENVNTYHLVRMVELIDKINSCDGKTKDLILKVIQMDKEAI